AVADSWAQRRAARRRGVDRRRHPRGRRTSRLAARHRPGRSAGRDAVAPGRRCGVGGIADDGADAARGCRSSGGPCFARPARNSPPQGAHYPENHRGHLMFVKPEERPFVTAELIRRTTYTATEKELKERFAALAETGFTEAAIQIIPGQEHAIEDWARIRR